ncbi:hypothetical protein LTR62_005450 [Meristemomyces frigidus]|uniref:Rhodanese domain-containing protein n=1 Tax=Meristemomyces frigidus TaxID=1508187 RepID=A0AAN7YQT0_9PEZI|nr:hypothetical protein LTR62_005450 [Meristemomyces frigidus]
MARPNSTFTSYLVTPSELNTALKRQPSDTDSRIIPLCGSWFLPNDPQKRKGHDVFQQSHIPTARFFDIDAISDTSSPYPHMLPSPELFQETMRSMGVKREDTVVVYDTAELGIFSAPRVAWTLKVFGHKGVHVLNNYRLWVEAGLPTEEGAGQTFERTEYPLPHLESSKIVSFEEMRDIARKSTSNNNDSSGINILDARSTGRWQGTEPEPRPGLPSGHIPGSTSVPVPELLDPETKAFLSAEQLRKVFERKGVDASKPVISSCGTGVTATVIETALIAAGYGEGEGRRVYDGSWTEWAMRAEGEDGLIVKGG